MKKLILVVFFLILISLSFAQDYTIKLEWDSFEGECDGYLNCYVDNEFAFMKGSSRSSILSDKVQSLGETGDFTSTQTFKIKSNNGKFSLWIKNKFSDQDLNNDPDLISKCKPKISIYKEKSLLKEISVEKGSGIVCKVLDFFPVNDEIIIFNKYYPKGRMVLGNITNAVNNNPIENVKIEVTDLTRSQKILETTKNGKFDMEYEIQEYFFTFTKPGFVSYKTKLRCNADEMPRELNVVLAPKIQKIRIVLTWDYKPNDLDAHLLGPKPNGETFHIWYRNQVEIGGKNFLDRDDLAHYGPETITIYKPTDGEYFYSVHNYSYRNIENSLSLSNSNAKVDIYADKRLLKSIKIPKNKAGNCWNVFKINKNHDLKIINTLKDEKKISNLFNL